jgi:hypothetical protein
MTDIKSFITAAKDSVRDYSATSPEEFAFVVVHHALIEWGFRCVGTGDEVHVGL